LHKDKIVNVHQLLASLPDFSRLRLVGVADLLGNAAKTGRKLKW
jgi:hypothetical protein